MEMQGIIRKMVSETREVAHYRLPVGEEFVDMNSLLSHEIRIEYSGKIHCIRCGRETARSFSQGYCYPCFLSAPETEECVLHPERCRAHEGVSRDMSYAESHCLIEHVVYLSLTSGLKVGVTRHTQVPVRWIDQGAEAAIELARTPNRFLAGQMEVFLKDSMADKTNWRRMLTGHSPEDVDLIDEKQRVALQLPGEYRKYLVPDDRLVRIRYPVERFPEKVRSVNLDKDPVLEGELTGIKGQYLIFRDNRVINIRKYGGYHVSFRAL